MKTRIVMGLLFLVSLVACSPDTLQGTFEKEQRNNGMDGFNIIHIEENDQYGLVVATSWTEQFIQNKNRPGIHVYDNENGKWVGRPGISCGDGRGSSILGIGNGMYVYCGVITEDRPFVTMAVGETEARIFDVNESIRVWYAVVNSRDLKISGTFDNGEKMILN
jgi:hypothetical protein